MQRTFLSFISLGTAVIATLGFCSSAQANMLYVDDGLQINNYLLPINPATPNPNEFSGSPGAGVTSMVFDLINNTSVLLAAASGSGEVYSYGPNGTQSIFATLSDPVGIAVNSVSDVFVGLGSGGGSKIEELTPNGSTINASFATNVVAQSLAVTAAGNVIAADDKSGNVYEYGPSGGTPTKIATLSASTDNYFGMAIDGSGDIYVSYQNSAVGSTSGGIYELTPNGSGYSLSTFFTAPTFLPTALALDPGTGNLYMSYVSSLSSPGGGVDMFTNTAGTLSATPITDITDTTGYPGGLAVLTPEPGSIMLFAGGLLSIYLLRFRRVGLSK